MKLKLLGDIHSDIQCLNSLMGPQEADLTIQIGDFGIGFGADAWMKSINPDRVKILFGNHDNWNVLKKLPHALDRFGVLRLENFSIFYVGGGWTPLEYRGLAGYDWFPDEELDLAESEECLQLWEKHCHEIDLVISHDGPPNVTQILLGEFPVETQTGRVLWEMWKIRRPRMWRFGHWHRSFVQTVGGTEFKCLSICQEEVLTV